MLKLNLEICDPSRADAPRLLALAALFTQLAQPTTVEQTRDKLASDVGGASFTGKGQNVPATLDPADNPATGMPSPAEAFGVGNGAAASGSASSPSPAQTGAALTSGPAASTMASPASIAPGAAAALPDPATAFGGAAPNAAAVPPPPSGPQTSNGATPQTLPPPSNGATNGSPLPIPPTAPAPGAAPAPAATISPAPAGVELDSEGVPWDASIHASSKTKIANGTWKVKRGTGEVYLADRKAMLKAAVAAGNAVAAGAPATPPGNALPPPVPAGAPVGNAQAPAPGATLPTQSQPTTQGTAGSSPLTMSTLLPRVTKAISAGLLTADSAGAIVSELSNGTVTAVAMLAVAPALIPQFAARLDALGIPL